MPPSVETAKAVVAVSFETNGAVVAFAVEAVNVVAPGGQAEAVVFPDKHVDVVA